jgi:hypothetical protein
MSRETGRGVARQFSCGDVNFWLDYASPHIPRRGAPQAPQGPGSVEVEAAEDPETAKTESS